ncbi:MAG: hypothetical protein ACPL6C_02820, partial [bacterium]
IYRAIRKESKIRFFPQKFGAILISSLILSLYLLLFHNTASNALSFAIVTLGGVLLYFSIFLFLSPFTDREKNYIKSVILKRI